MSTEIERIIVDPGQFLDFIARRAKGKVSVEDLVQAIKIANIGELVGSQRKLPRSANEEVFKDDLLPTVQNSIFKVLVMVTGTASILDVLYKEGNQVSVIQALDGNALQPRIAKEFNFVVSRGIKINFAPETDTTIDLIRVVEFRIGQ